jgi:hypothetical protein
LKYVLEANWVIKSILAFSSSRMFLSFLALTLIVDVLTFVEVPSASSKIDDLSY